MDSSQADKSCRERVADSSARFGRVATWFWVLFWLIFLVQPVRRSFTSDPSHAWGGVCLIVGGLVYVAVMLRAIKSQLRRGVAPRRERAIAAAATVLVVGLMFTASLVVGQDGFALLPFAAVVATVGVGVPWGLALALAVCGLSYALSGHVTGGALAPGLLFSSLASGVAAFFGVYSARRGLAARRAQEDSALLRIQDERNRMARDLHDILGHTLTVITVKAELAGRLVDIDPIKAREQIAEMERLSRSALADVRRTVAGYREISLAGEIVHARNALEDAGIHADLPGNVDDVEPDLRELFAWTLREATTNVIRHSGAKRCTVTLVPNRIDVADDGQGFGGRAEGNGLRGLRERAQTAGAEVRISDAAGGLVSVGVFEDTAR